MPSLFHLVSASLLVVTFAAANTTVTAVLAGQRAESHTIQVTVNSAQRTYACQSSGDSIQVAGSSDVLHITGSCGSLLVTGRGNIITLDSVQNVELRGNGNKIFYRNSRPNIKDHGFGNSMDKASDHASTAPAGATKAA